MDFLGRIRKLDSTLQRGLDNSFARVFGGKVVPNELEECLKQEIDDFLMQDTDGKFLAPNDFRIGVSTADFANLSENEGRLPVQLAERMGRYCRNNGWSMSGPITVRVQEVSSLHTGQLKTASNFTAEAGTSAYFNADDQALDMPAAGGDQAATSAEFRPEPQPEPVAEEEFPTASRPIPAQPEPEPVETNEPTFTLLLQDGSSRVFEVRHGSNIIGRGTASDFRLPDTGVSRQHAEITWDGQDAVLVDLHSTNGTIVNGEEIDNWLLADGDIISMGHSVMEVRIR